MRSNRRCVRTTLLLIFSLTVFCSGIARAQESSSVAGDVTDGPDPGQGSKGLAAPGAQRDVSLKLLPSNFLEDQKNLWLFPARLGQNRHWIPTAVVIGGTAAFLAADPHDVSYFRNTTSFHGFNRTFGKHVTTAEMVIVPATFYLVGLARHDSYTQKTALSAGEAVVDGIVLYGAMTALTRRVRPSEIPPSGPFDDTFFRAHNGVFGHSFPSGHSMEAFALATVFATRYRDHKWVPWVAYAAAATIALSRVTSSSHFPADAFVGAALGYSIARFDVLRVH